MDEEEEEDYWVGSAANVCACSVLRLPYVLLQLVLRWRRRRRHQGRTIRMGVRPWELEQKTKKKKKKKK